MAFSCSDCVSRSSIFRLRCRKGRAGEGGRGRTTKNKQIILSEPAGSERLAIHLDPYYVGSLGRKAEKVVRAAEQRGQERRKKKSEIKHIFFQEKKGGQPADFFLVHQAVVEQLLRTAKGEEGEGEEGEGEEDDERRRRRRKKKKTTKEEEDDESRRQQGRRKKKTRKTKEDE